MSVKALHWAFGQKVQPTKKVVLLALADEARDGGACWPSLRRLQDKASVSRRTAQRTIEALVKEGLLLVCSREAAGGRQTSNLYVLKMPGWEEEVVSWEGVNLTPQGVSHVDTGEGVTATTPPLPLNHQKEPLEGTFERFWNATWKRGSKGAASRAFHKVLAGPDAPDVETLILAAEAKTEAYQGTESRWRAHVATWLNQRRWTRHDEESPEDEAADEVLEALRNAGVEV